MQFVTLMFSSSDALDVDVPPATTYNTIPESAFETAIRRWGPRALHLPAPKQGASMDMLTDGDETSSADAQAGGAGAAEELQVVDGTYSWVRSKSRRKKVLEVGPPSPSELRFWWFVDSSRRHVLPPPPCFLFVTHRRGQRSEPYPSTWQALAGLKAYCRLKHTDAHDFASRHSHNAFLAFVDEFGNRIPKAKAVKVIIPGMKDFGSIGTGEKLNQYNIIENFGYIMGKIQSKYSRGVGRYVLKHVDYTLQTAAVADDASSQFLATFDDKNGKTHVMFKPKAAGFNSTPKYLKKLAHRHSRWAKEYASVYASAKHILKNERGLWKAIAGDNLQTKFRQFYRDTSAGDIKKRIGSTGKKQGRGDVLHKLINKASTITELKNTHEAKFDQMAKNLAVNKHLVKNLTAKAAGLEREMANEKVYVKQLQRDVKGLEKNGIEEKTEKRQHADQSKEFAAKHAEAKRQAERLAQKESWFKQRAIKQAKELSRKDAKARTQRQKMRKRQQALARAAGNRDRRIKSLRKNTAKAFGRVAWRNRELHQKIAKKVNRKKYKVLKRFGRKCAREHRTCRCNGMVTYGARGKWKRKVSNGSIRCANNVFGDPIGGVSKSCYCKAMKAPTKFGQQRQAVLAPGL